MLPHRDITYQINILKLIHLFKLYINKIVAIKETICNEMR